MSEQPVDEVPVLASAITLVVTAEVIPGDPEPEEER